MPYELNSDTKELIQRLWITGHINFPRGKQQESVDEGQCRKLDIKHPVVQRAIASYQRLDINAEYLSQLIHHRECQPDGDIGPATETVLTADRCELIDYGPGSGNEWLDTDWKDEDTPPDAPPVAQAQGSGNWRGCHGVGNFHSCSVKVNNAPPAFLSPIFEQVKKNITQAYAEVGLLFRFDAPSPVNINWHFVNRSSGWIGLAQVVNNATCTSSAIWCQYLATYTGGSNDAARLAQWTTLGNHELCHNCGIGHTRGGKMNPSIVNGLPTSWAGDPTRPALVSRFGGVPVPYLDDQPPTPDHELVIGYMAPDGTFTKLRTIDRTGKDGHWFPKASMN